MNERKGFFSSDVSQAKSLVRIPVYRRIISSHRKPARFEKIISICEQFWAN